MKQAGGPKPMQGSPPVPSPVAGHLAQQNAAARFGHGNAVGGGYGSSTESVVGTSVQQWHTQCFAS